MTPLLSESGFDAIIVAPTYRLNIFGFIASKELQDEAASVGQSAGNLGFWDQRAALEWTGKNIGYFGGDADNITVGGESRSLSCNLYRCHLITNALYRLLCRIAQRFPPASS